MRELWWSGGHTTSGRRMASRPHRWCPVTTGVIRWLVCGALVIAGLSQASGGEAGPLYRWIDDQGRSHLSDTPPPSITPPQSQGAKAPDTPGPVARPTPPAAKAPGLPIVDAEVNRRLTVRFQLAPEVELTILSKAVAAQLGLASIDHLHRPPAQTLDPHRGRDPRGPHHCPALSARRRGGGPRCQRRHRRRWSAHRGTPRPIIPAPLRDDRRRSGAGHVHPRAPHALANRVIILFTSVRTSADRIGSSSPRKFAYVVFR